MFQQPQPQAQVAVEALADMVSARVARKVILGLLAAVMIWFYVQVLSDVMSQPEEPEQVPDPAWSGPIPFPFQGGVHNVPG